MESLPTKSLHDGPSLPVLGLGTWKMGGGMVRERDNDDRRDIAAIEGAIQAGITHLDTAEVYAEGRAEEMVGEAVRGIDRSRLFIASKVWRDNLAYNRVKTSAQRSLERLSLDYLDLYYIHAFNPDVPLGETMQALNELHQEGLIRHIGVSNFAPERIEEARQYSSVPILCDQAHYNLQFREPERRGLLDYCAAHDMLLVAWRPLQYGTLQGAGRLSLVDELCRKYDLTPAQLAISWLTSQPGIVTIVKTSNLQHLAENVAGAHCRMDDADIERLRREFPGQEAVSNSMPLQ